jgi:hypothetical protein
MKRILFCAAAAAALLNGCTKDEMVQVRGTITGTVVYGEESGPLSKPLAGASVAYYEGSTAKTAVTDGAGTYVINNVPPGTMTLTISMAGYATKTVDVTVVNPYVTQGSMPVIKGGGTVAVSANAGVTLLQKADAKLTATAKNKITTDEGKSYTEYVPLSGANVSLVVNGVVFEAVTGTDGKFTVEGLPAGSNSYRFAAQKSSETYQFVSSSSSSSENFILASGATYDAGDLEFRKANPLVGSVIVETNFMVTLSAPPTGPLTVTFRKDKEPKQTPEQPTNFSVSIAGYKATASVSGNTLNITPGRTLEQGTNSITISNLTFKDGSTFSTDEQNTLSVDIAKTDFHLADASLFKSADGAVKYAATQSNYRTYDLAADLEIELTFNRAVKAGVNGVVSGVSVSGVSTYLDAQYYTAKRSETDNKVVVVKILKQGLSANQFYQVSLNSGLQSDEGEEAPFTYQSSTTLYFKTADAAFRLERSTLFDGGKNATQASYNTYPMAEDVNIELTFNRAVKAGVNGVVSGVSVSGVSTDYYTAKRKGNSDDDKKVVVVKILKQGLYANQFYYVSLNTLLQSDEGDDASFDYPTYNQLYFKTGLAEFRFLTSSLYTGGYAATSTDCLVIPRADLNLSTPFEFTLTFSRPVRADANNAVTGLTLYMNGSPMYSQYYTITTDATNTSMVRVSVDRSQLINGNSYYIQGSVYDAERSGYDYSTGIQQASLPSALYFKVEEMPRAVPQNIPNAEAWSNMYSTMDDYLNTLEYSTSYLAIRWDTTGNIGNAISFQYRVKDSKTNGWTESSTNWWSYPQRSGAYYTASVTLNTTSAPVYNTYYLSDNLDVQVQVRATNTIDGRPVFSQWKDVSTGSKKFKDNKAPTYSGTQPLMVNTMSSLNNTDGTSVRTVQVYVSVSNSSITGWENYWESSSYRNKMVVSVSSDIEGSASIAATNVTSQYQGSTSSTFNFEVTVPVGEDARSKTFKIKVKDSSGNESSEINCQLSNY